MLAAKRLLVFLCVAVVASRGAVCQYLVNGTVRYGCLPPSGCECGRFESDMYGSFSVTENLSGQYELHGVVLNFTYNFNPVTATGTGILQHSELTFDEDGRAHGKQQGRIELSLPQRASAPLVLHINETVSTPPPTLYVALATNGRTCGGGFQVNMYARRVCT